MSYCSAVGRNWSRLDVIKHAISNFVQAKRWSCGQHKFGLIAVTKDTCALLPLGVTSSADRLLEALQSLQPSSSGLEAQQEGGALQQPASSSSRAFDLGSLIAAVQPLQQQPQQQHCAAGQPMLGGMLMPVSSSNSGRGSSSSSTSSSSSSRQPQQLLRVVLVYCRSRLPAPVWNSHRQAGLAVDCLHVHDKPQPGDQQQQLQVRQLTAWRAQSLHTVAPTRPAQRHTERVWLLQPHHSAAAIPLGSG